MQVAIRPYKNSDITVLLDLFRATVHTVAARYYTPEQVRAWAPLNLSDDEQHNMETTWSTRLALQITLVAEVDNSIVGFISMTHEGHLDLLYVDKEHQAQGVAYLLFKQIESIAREKRIGHITTHASNMAVPLAKRIGFAIIKEDIVERRGVFMPRYEMIKKL